MKYLLKMRNPKSGRVEVYATEIDNADLIPLILDFWKNDAGYEILSFKPKANGVYKRTKADDRGV